MKDFKEKTIKGLSYSFISQISVQISRLATTIILARFFLSPEDFGVFNISLIIIAFSNILADSGFGAALIQKKNAGQVDYSSVFWLNVAISVVVSILLVLFSRKIAVYYETPVLEYVLYAQIPIYILNACTIVQKVLLQKALKFKILAVSNIVATFSASIIAIFFGWKEWGLWALVIYQLLIALVSNLWLWLAVKNWKPQIIFSWNSIKEIGVFSLNLLGNSSLNYWSKNVDKLIVGKVIGQHALGLYSQAFALVLIPVSNISNVFVSVLFPSFSLIQKQKEKISRIFTKTSKAILLVNGAIFFALFGIADLFVILVLGPKWLGMEKLLRVFCIVGLVISLRTIQSGVFMSQNKNGLLFRLNIVSRVITITSLLLIAPYGMMSIAYCVLVTFFLSWVLNTWFSCKILESSFLRFVGAHIRIVFFGLSALGITLLQRSFLAVESEILTVITSLSTFFILYFAGLFFTKEQSLFDIAEIVKNKMNRKKPKPV